MGSVNIDVDDSYIETLSVLTALCCRTKKSKYKIHSTNSTFLLLFADYLDRARGKRRQVRASRSADLFAKLWNEYTRMARRTGHEQISGSSVTELSGFSR